MIELPPLASPVDQLWHAILDLSERLTIPWTLVGGQMVLLHALEHGLRIRDRIVRSVSQRQRRRHRPVATPIQ